MVTIYFDFVTRFSSEIWGYANDRYCLMIFGPFFQINIINNLEEFVTWRKVFLFLKSVLVMPENQMSSFKSLSLS